MSEFTGERVIPGLVDTDLLNEHLARYRFAARFARAGAGVLDAGCGTGYGVVEFAAGVSVTATDISADAIGYARVHFTRPGVRFVQASCETLPFADGSFDLVVAFEVIEHLERWERLLEEARRILRPSGVLLVSTPNKAYYAESRAKAGPNPFHCREFEYEEFEAALYAVFPHVRMWTQNHAESIVFAPANPAGATLDANGDATPANAHFFLGACSQSAVELNEVYAWLPASANVLREREHHIAKLEGELREKTRWLEKLVADHSTLQTVHEETVSELRERNRWASRLDEELAAGGALIRELQEEVDNRLAWIGNLEIQIAAGSREIERLNAHRQELESDLAARAAWGLGLDAEVERQAREIETRTAEVRELSGSLMQLSAQRRLVANSKWLRLGRKLHLGPMVDGE